MVLLKKLKLSRLICDLFFGMKKGGPYVNLFDPHKGHSCFSGHILLSSMSTRCFYVIFIHAKIRRGASDGCLMFRDFK